MTRSRFLLLSGAGLILLASALLSVFAGIEFTDTGFIEGLAYRLFRGQKIYQDFDYARPPLTPWLWHFVFYLGSDGMELVFRSLVVAQKAATAFFIYKILNSVQINAWKSCISALLAFGFLLHYIPSMPWHTTDGLFFVTASALFAADKKYYWAVAFATFAALCKQSFYPAPFLVIAMAGATDRRKILPLLGALLAVAALVIYPFGFQNFVRATAGSGSLHELLQIGLKPHIDPSAGFLAGLVFLLASCLALGAVAQVSCIERVYLAALLLPVFGVVQGLGKKIFFSIDTEFPQVQPGITHVAVVVLLLGVAARFYRNKSSLYKEDKFLVAFYLCAAAWMSTISWGYANYIFAFGLVLAAAVIFFDDQIEMDSAAGALVMVAGLALLLAGRVVFPYRMESPLSASYQPVSGGHYKFVRASAREISKLDSIKKLSQTAGCKDTFPSVPQAALVGNYMPALRADWKMDVEYPSHSAESEQQRLQACAIFVESDARVLNWTGKFKSTALDIRKNEKCMHTFDTNFKQINLNQCQTAP